MVCSRMGPSLAVHGEGEEIPCVLFSISLIVIVNKYTAHAHMHIAHMHKHTCTHAASTMSDLEEFEPVSCSTQFRISYYTRTKHHPSGSSVCPIHTDWRMYVTLCAGAESMLKNTKQLSRVFRDSIAHTLLTEIRKGGSTLTGSRRLET